MFNRTREVFSFVASPGSDSVASFATETFIDIVVGFVSNEALNRPYGEKKI